MKSGISKDQPKNNPWLHDKLGYANFSKSLATSILALDAKSGFVVGLSGVWGSGKTTALNFTRSYLDKHNQETQVENEKINIVEFNPWLFSGKTDLISAFFKVLSEHVPQIVGENPNGNALKLTGERVSDLAGAISKLGILVDPATSALFNAGVHLGKREFDRSIEKWAAAPSLQTAYEDLFQKLQAKKTKILVIIDDLDRLEPSEIRSIMQLVKSVGSLPNVIYLLSYDRRRIDFALSEYDNDKSDGPKFLEKIVQQELALPVCSQRSLLRLLDDHFEHLSGDIEDNERWHTIVSSGIRQWIQTPRDVFRYTNSLKFVWPALIEEVDGADIMAMEGFRLFNQTVFNWIKENRAFFFSEDTFLMGQKDKQKEKWLEILDQFHGAERKNLQRLLACLFPTLSDSLPQDGIFGNEPYYKMKIRGGVASEKGFDLYFSRYLTEEMVKRSDIDAFISKSDDLKAMETLLRTFMNGPPWSPIGEFVSELSLRFIDDEEAVQPTFEMLKAFIRVSDDLGGHKRRRSLFGSSAHFEVLYLLNKFFDKWGGELAADYFIKALTSEDALSFGCVVYLDHGQKSGEIPDEVARASKSPFSREQWNKIGDCLKEKIREGKKDNSIYGKPYMWAVIKTHALLFGSTKTQKWIASNISIRFEFLCSVVDANVGEQAGATANPYIFRGSLDEDIYDKSLVQKLVKQALAGSSLSDEQRKQFTAMQDGFDGKSDW